MQASSLPELTPSLSTSLSTSLSPSFPPSPAWWRLPIVWMVIAGPALVVVASFATLALALIYPDPVVQGPVATVKSAQPAMQARNHAAAPGP